MNNKFTQVVKVKEENVNKIELSLVKCKALDKELKRSMEAIIDELNLHRFPRGGSSADIKINLEEQKLLRDQKERIKERIILNQKEIVHYEFQHKKAYIELEKMKYLEQEETAKEIARIKKQEAKDLDEIAVQRYSFMKDTK
ncbi:flagellar export protein FliJ [Campylobacter fetus]|uniref:flagellar export protein FliJ n=1 Tax=Campylobacter fetus TaxID=196 RepID=UPI00073ACB7B|nr:flagellar export protein FliJ [Campylobacter fetus]ALV64364.1 putative flagellar protein FliJ [Campylobacter fetus subsp. testudinum Sp3]AVK80675.1 hypothetical protein C6B32_02105 [Campylobacter fetus subsp. testudinum]MPB72732.1 hypothetical protein [Campylobacter fetus]MPB76815.1 hypothetical protein [Campylobacter fetus]OCR85504.1 hypothetical protein CFT12S05168_04910 [Campylobacter fetus subsp. testudinum]